MYKSNETVGRIKRTLDEKASRVVFWTGAGLSAPSKLPNWNGLIDKLDQKCEELEVDGLLGKSDIELLKKARAEHDNWRRTSFYEKILRNADFKGVIRQALRESENVIVPKNYLNIWKLGIEGLITLNLDEFATKAYHEVHQDISLNNFTGLELGSQFRTLQRSSNWVCNLHGILGDEKSWVLTSKKKNVLLQSPGYHKFITTLLGSRTVIFVGVSADDSAIRVHLDALIKAECDFTHYWITSRKDPETRNFASSRNLETVFYDAKDQHKELEDILKYLGSKPEAVKPPKIVKPTSFSPHVLDVVGDDDLANRKPNEIREYINQKAINIVEHDRNPESKTYRALIEEYERSIYHAWYIPKNPKGAKFFDYTLNQRISSDGAFGQVYRATNSSGEKCAIKIVHQGIRAEPEMLAAFRRGVEALSVISDSKHLQGQIVRFLGAWELPAAVAMDFIPGFDLQTAKDSGMVKRWDQVVTIASQMAGALRIAHRLGVRHRDVRPPNIMLRDFYSFGDEIHVVLLDFDLSWHKDATGDSLALTSTPYRAPEQSREFSERVTRNALVDSFGFGMTLFYLTHESTPKTNAHLAGDWVERAAPDGNLRACNEWRSLPTRISRMIVSATSHVQADRRDMTSLESELSTLCKILVDGLVPGDPNYLIEELAERMPIISGRGRFSDDLGSYLFAADSGLTVRLSGGLNSDQLSFELGWENRGATEYKNVRKYIEPKSKEACDVLKGFGFTIKQRKLTSTQVIVVADFPLNSITSLAIISRLAHVMNDALVPLMRVAPI